MLEGMKRVLLVTNDFPPRAGGIQTYLEGFASRLDPAALVILTSVPGDGSEAIYDEAHPWTCYRYPTTMLLPTPRVAAYMQEIIRKEQIEVVWFGAAAPLGLLAWAARQAGARHIIATTHGHEIGWSMIPGARTMLKKIFHDADTVTYLTSATLKRLAPLIPVEKNLLRMPGGIQPELFRRDEQQRARLRQHYGIEADAPVVVCISRLVERKGQDVLLRGWHKVIKEHPNAHLVIVGKGPYGNHLHALHNRQVQRWPEIAGTVTFTEEVPYEELAAHYSLGDVFAMPCRTRGGGLDIEGLGIVYLEAYGAGLPVIAGDSGGAPEAVIDGQTGLVVAGRNVDGVAKALNYLLAHPQRAAAMGARGKEWIREAWTWEHLISPLKEILA